MAFVDLEISAQRADLVALMTERLQAEYPGWQPSAFETVLLEAVAEMGVQVLEQASVVPASIFRAYGEQIIGLSPEDGAQASVACTWTTIDSLGYTIPAGTQVALSADDGSTWVFELGADVAIAPASTTGAGTLYASEVGAGGNGITGAATLLDSLAYVSGVTITGATSGGADAETDEEYQDRLAAELRLLSPRPILPGDFAVLARRVSGVARALAIDGYNPASGGTYGNARTVSVACIDSSGVAVSAGVKTAVDALLQAYREVNFEVYVVDPTTTTVNVVVTAHSHSGWDTAGVKAAAESALASHLSPARWGIPPGGDATDWTSRTKVRYLEVAGVLENVAGLDYIDTLTLNGGTSDITLSGVAPLPAAGTVTVTITAP